MTRYACMKHFHKLSCNYFQVVFMERCDYIYLCHDNIYTAVHSVHEGVMDSCSNYLELLRIPIDYQVYYTTSGDKLYLQFVSFHLVSCVKKFCAKCWHGNFVILNINLEIYTEINATSCHPWYYLFHVFLIHTAWHWNSFPDGYFAWNSQIAALCWSTRC